MTQKQSQLTQEIPKEILKIIFENCEDTALSTIFGTQQFDPFLLDRYLIDNFENCEEHNHIHQNLINAFGENNAKLVETFFCQ